MKTKQLNLMEVGRDGPTRKQRIEAFKQEHGIETHFAGRNFCEGAWSACWVQQCRESLKGYGAKETHDWFDLMANWGRLIEDGDLISYKNSELAAIREVCALNQIPCDL